MQTSRVSQLIRDGVVLAYEEAGSGDPPLVFVHGVACHRGFWVSQLGHFARARRVIAVDLRGHGGSDAPEQRYTIAGFADDLAWTCMQLEVLRPVVVGHSLGGLIGLALAADPARVSAVALIDSVLLPSAGRDGVVGELVAGLRSPDSERTLRDYFETFFGRDDDLARQAWILEQAIRTPPHVTSSVWEESLRSWDDEEALRRCQVPALYLDAGTANADLVRARQLCPQLTIGQTIGSGHFSPLEVPEQVNPMLERFLTMRVDR